ncbi:MAG: Gfo/Idh/MocA family oxidoreductase [Actinomycetota bacterium]|nr:Gfo/Idh/MocA family oxidoreductase [Actinomycetota bacterium]
MRSALEAGGRGTQVLGRPRLGFAGVGWIGRHRLEAVVSADLADIVVIADPSAESAQAARDAAPGAAVVDSFEEVLDHQDLDGIVLATPSALHASQSISCLERGLAVFCQKPLALTAPETKSVLEAAAAADRLLAVDLSYRWTDALQKMRSLIGAGEIGRVFAAELTFHNAYGPDKPWFLDPRLSGGGCAIDLGTHLIDAALWALEWPQVAAVSSRLLRRARRVTSGEEVEDYATAELELADDVRVRLACSWFLHAGRDAQIEISFYGEDGSVSLHNVGGSFYDFKAELWRGTTTSVISEPPDAWGGRAAVEWTRRLAAGNGFDSDIDHLLQVSEVLDRIYGRAA